MSRSAPGPDRPFARWLGEAMAERRVCQRDLATLAGVDHSTICRLLHGERQPSLATAARLGRALEVPLDLASMARPRDEMPTRGRRSLLAATAGPCSGVPAESLATERLIRRIRWVRGMKRALAPASAGRLAVDAEECRLLALLRARFGVTTITSAGLEWLTCWRQRDDDPRAEGRLGGQKRRLGRQY